MFVDDTIDSGNLIAQTPKNNSLQKDLANVRAAAEQAIKDNIFNCYEIVNSYKNEDDESIIETCLIRYVEGVEQSLDFIFWLSNNRLPFFEYLVPIAEYKNVDNLQMLVDRLWSLLDDIDTSSDIAKDNIAWRIQHIDNLQRKRFEYVTSDGYNLFVRQSVAERFGNTHD